jgi:hypothetical protein
MVRRRYTRWSERLESSPFDRLRVSDLCLLLEQLSAFRQRELKTAHWQARIDLHGAEVDQAALTEAVGDVELLQGIALEADAHGLKSAVCCLWAGADPHEAVFVGGIFEGEFSAQDGEVDGRGDQCGRGVGEGAGLLALRGLVQVGVVDPQMRAVGQDELLEGFFVLKFEFAGALEFKAAAGVFHAWRFARASRGGDGLLELGFSGFDCFDEVFKAF